MAARGSGQSVGGGGGVNPNLSQTLQPPQFDLSGLLQAPSQPIPSRCSPPPVEEEAAGPTFDHTRVLLRRVFFLSHIKNRYMSRILPGSQLQGSSGIWRSTNHTDVPDGTADEDVVGQPIEPL
jgi:hypothetical protein